MLVPSSRLLLFTAALVVPLATLAGVSPALAWPCLATLAVCGAIAAWDALRGASSLRGIALRAPALLRFTKGVESNFSLVIENGSAAPRPLRLALTLPESIETPTPVLELVAPAGACEASWPCIARARGDFSPREIPIETLSPLGLWLVRSARPIDSSIRVYPNLRDRATAALFLRSAVSGLRLCRQVGKGREFENLRHYLPGDCFEDIDWKATARRGFPTVKLYRVEQSQEVYAIVDASRLSAREDILESYVDAALHLALVAEKHGDRFGLITFSDRTHHFVRAASGMDHFRLCRETIYNLQARRVSPDFGDVFTSVQTGLRRRSLLVFFTSLDDALLAESFERGVSLLARRHIVRVMMRSTAALSPLDQSAPVRTPDDVYEVLSGQLLAGRMRTLESALSIRGAGLQLASASEMNARTSACYQTVKRRQLL
jgi:uncharacterized protein (DUF58 family)